jgi:hypothetical protein
MKYAELQRWCMIKGLKMALTVNRWRINWLSKSGMDAVLILPMIRAAYNSRRDLLTRLEKAQCE